MGWVGVFGEGVGEEKVYKGGRGGGGFGRGGGGEGFEEVDVCEFVGLEVGRGYFRIEEVELAIWGLGGMGEYWILDWKPLRRLRSRQVFGWVVLEVFELSMSVIWVILSWACLSRKRSRLLIRSEGATS